MKEVIINPREQQNLEVIETLTKQEIMPIRRIVHRIRKENLNMQLSNKIGQPNLHQSHLLITHIDLGI
jgi:hypothetical protein